MAREVNKTGCEGTRAKRKVFCGAAGRCMRVMETAERYYHCHSHHCSGDLISSNRLFTLVRG